MPQPNAANSNGQISPACSLRVLVAEDNPTNQLVIRSILETAQHEPVMVSDGEAALNALEVGHYDLAIIDMHMPKMNGIDVIKFAKWTLPEEGVIPFIVLTADATQGALEECLAAGASAFVTKPVEPRRLLKEIDAVMARRKQRVASHEAGKTAVVATIDQPAFDGEQLDDLVSLGHSEVLIASIVKAFEEDAERILDQLRRAFGVAHFNDLRELSHAFRGCAASVGAKQLQALCASVEQLDDLQLVEQSATIMHDLVDAYQATRGALQIYMKREFKSASSRPRPSHLRDGDKGQAASRRR